MTLCQIAGERLFLLYRDLDKIIEEVDQKLKDIMVNIYNNISSAAKEAGQEDNFVVGANIAGFKKVAEAMMAQGAV